MSLISPTISKYIQRIPENGPDFSYRAIGLIIPPEPNRFNTLPSQHSPRLLCHQGSQVLGYGADEKFKNAVTALGESWV